jgi:hypothetical protein
MQLLQSVYPDGSALSINYSVSIVANCWPFADTRSLTSNILRSIVGGCV